ncbi:15865_t:CDS:2, partial [Racocetra fulgida]
IERPRPEAQDCEIEHLLEAPSSWTVIFDDPTVRNELSTAMTTPDVSFKIHIRVFVKDQQTESAKIRRMQLKCIELLTALTKEQTAEVWKINDKTISNRIFNDPQALELFLERKSPPIVSLVVSSLKVPPTQP